jgi:signal transduction histidine kinase
MRRVDTPLAAGPAAPEGLRASSTVQDALADRVHRSVPLLSRASDVALVAITALLATADAAVWATDRVSDAGRLPVSLAVLVPCLGAVAVAAVAMRPRRSVAALAVLSVASLLVTASCVATSASVPPSFAALFAVGVLTMVVLRREAGRRALLLVGLAGGAVVAESVRPQVAGVGYLLVIGVGGFLAAIAGGLYLRWSDWRRATAAAVARAQERVEIARELHDMVGHHLAGIVVQAQAARHVRSTDPGSAYESLERIERSGGDALLAMRAMVGALRTDCAPAVAAPGACWHDVENLASGVGPGLRVLTVIAPEVAALDPSLAPSVHRIVAEGLTNAQRHADGATLVEVVLEVVDDRLVIEVRDDGAAKGAPAPGGFGLVGVRERAEALGGSSSAGPLVGGGWRVRVELPARRGG